MCIPTSLLGINELSACVILVDIGCDMSRIETLGQPIFWAGLCARNDETARKQRLGAEYAVQCDLCGFWKPKWIQCTTDGVTCNQFDAEAYGLNPALLRLVGNLIRRYGASAG